ncbi:MAG: hypothetical protein H6981_04515 [Gammaproteobacteria bacterium]|nr:hypothetical protein [Gammaproteobacteria bacterium]
MSAPLPPEEEARRHHLARYLAGRSPSGAAVPRDVRAAMYRRMKRTRPGLIADLDRRIAAMGGRS